MNLPLNIDIRQILLHMLNFVILFGGLYFILYNPVKKFILSRAKMYEDMDKSAKAKIKEADALKQSYEDKIKAAEEEISEMKAEMQEKAELAAKSVVDKAKAEAVEILNKAKTQAEYEARDSLLHANAEVSKIAVSAAKKLIFDSTSDAYDAFLDNAKGDAKSGK